MDQRTHKISDVEERPDADGYETIMRSLGVGVCRLDRSGQILYANDSAGKILGQKPREIIGKPYPSVFFGSDITKEDPRCGPIEFTLTVDEVSHISTETISRTDGSEYLAELICVPVANGDETGGAVVSFMDVTDRRDVEAAVSSARDEALDAARAKAEFLANMSHEVRTPLTGIIGTVELLNRTDPTDEQVELIRMLKSSAEFLHGIVNDILDFSKIEAGKFYPHARDFAFADLAARCVDSYRSVAAEKGIALSHEIDETLPPRVVGDAKLIQQVINNLLNNGLKFTDVGSVKLRIGPGKRPGKTRFSVEDTGIGITQTEHEILFSPFTQADSSNKRPGGGTGLGLAISRRLVELLNGEIGIQSKDGGGTVVWFEVPLDPAEGGQEAIIEESDELPEFQPLKILIVEDNPINMRVISKMLLRIGLESDGVENGQDAITACEENNYDIVFMDCQMPEMDGYEASSKIRGISDEPPLLIAFTASISEHETARIESAGMSGILRKPFTEKDLIDVIRANFGKSVENKSLDLDTDIREHSISEFIEFETLKRLRSLETDDPGGFLAEILEVFAEHTAGILPELKKCVSNNERDEVKRIAHNLKGSSANIGITVLSALFEELENKALDCDREVLDKLLHNIIGEFDSVSASIFKLKDEVDPNEA